MKEQLEMIWLINLEILVPNLKNHNIILRIDDVHPYFAFRQHLWMPVPNISLDNSYDAIIAEKLNVTNNTHIKVIKDINNQAIQNPYSTHNDFIIKRFEIDDNIFCITNDRRIIGIIQLDDQEFYVWGEYPDPVNQDINQLRNKVVGDFGLELEDREDFIELIKKIYPRYFNK